MIQVYVKGNENFNMNGDRVIYPTLCAVDMELNGAWEMELEHPIDEKGDFQFLQEESIISAPTPVGERQLFKIYSTVKTDTAVTAYARPVYYDAAHEVFLLNGRIEQQTGQQVLDKLTAGTKYSGTSNIVTKASADYTYQNLIEALNGTDEESFLSKWGGEILYDNYRVIVNDRIGGDYGARAEFGHNLDGIEEEINVDELVTCIFPVAYKDYTLGGEAPFVDSPLIGRYAHPYIKRVEFEDVKLLEDAGENEKGFKTLAELRAELVRRCEKMFDEGCDKPTCNYKVNMVDLSQTKEYKDYACLEKVRLGDTVHCKHQKLGIETDARVIRIKYDCILQRNVEEELGDFSYNYFHDITAATEKVNNLALNKSSIQAEKVSGVLDARSTQLKGQKTTGDMQDIRAVLFEDLDEASSTYGALSIGTRGIQIASRKTAVGGDWDWKTVITGGGMKDVDIRDGAINIYDDSFAEQCSGSIRSLTAVSDESNAYLPKGSKGIGIYHAPGKVLALASKDVADGSASNVKLVIDEEHDTPFIAGTANGTIQLAGGGTIQVENGLITRWEIPAVSEASVSLTEMSTPDSLNKALKMKGEVEE